MDALVAKFVDLMWKVAWAVCAILLVIILCKALVLIVRCKKAVVRFAFRSRKAKGIIFGRDSVGRYAYSPTNQEGSCFVVGQPGSGKTSALLIPTLRSWTGSSMVIDIAGDISSNVDCPNKLVFDPSSPNTVAYNIFGVIDNLPDQEAQNEALEELAYLLMPEDPCANSNSKYFQDGGRSMLIAALLAFYPQGMDFCEICRLADTLPYRELLSMIDATNNPNAIAYINQFEDASPINTQGCKQNLSKAVELFSRSTTIHKSLRRPASGEHAITPADIENHNVFIVIPDQKLKRYAPLLAIITSQAFDHLSARPNGASPTVLLCLDEFHSLGKLQIGDALRKLRKKNVRIMVLTQSVSDIDEVYGHNAHIAMIDNFTFKVILGAGGRESQDYFAKMIGKEQKKHTSYTRSTNSAFSSSRESETVSYSEDFVISPSDLGHLKNKLVLLHPDGHTVLKKNYYHKKRLLNRILQIFRSKQKKDRKK